MSTQPSEEGPVLSVIIVNYNVRDLLENALHSLTVALRGIRGEIIVVDNASDDGSVEMIRSAFPDLILVANQSNHGFARANNQGLRIAGGRFILILNPDTLLQEDTLQVMLAFFRENPDVGMAGCKIIEPDGRVEPNSRRSFPSPWVSFTKLSGLSALFPKSKFFGKYNLTYLSDEETYEVDALSGCFIMLRREVFEEIGGFDEEYFMYGEDLDWCFRTQKAGWKIYYVHATKIIHYGGESTKRSSIDAKAVFYDAMQLFVKKNLNLSPLTRIFIRSGIGMRLLLSRSKRIVLRTIPAITDAVIVIGAIILGELLRFGGVFTFPAYAYPTVYIASVLIYSLSLAISGSYTSNEHTVARSFIGVGLGFLVTSSLTFFFKDFAFSRAVVLIASALLFILIPAPRMYRRFFHGRGGSSLITGRPTLLVGITDQLGEIVDKLRSSPNAFYRIAGIIDTDRKRIGEEIAGIRIIGSTANIGKVIFENRITDVIFLPDVLSYSEIVSIISRNKGTPVHYRMVARNLELIVGRAEIDQLSTVPLVDVEYNIVRLSNSVIKRSMDLCVALLGLIALYPFVYFLARKPVPERFTFRQAVMRLPKVLRGRMSLVGGSGLYSNEEGSLYLGKPGVTGLVQLQGSNRISPDDVLKLELQYARNQTFFLDVEILLRTFARMLRKVPNHTEERQ